MARKKASENKVEVGNIREVSGKVTIAGGNIYTGYTVEQVSLLLKEITTDYRRKPFTGRCPYKGLDVFEEEDADLFFGRERLVEDLLGRVKESRTVFITGPSGSGKSSLLRAGLIHALKSGAIKGSERWLYETMKPGREPLKELSLVFSRLKSPELANYFHAHANDVNILHDCAESVLTGRKDQRFVLFVDQFEEVFTQIGNEEERRAFIHMLARAGAVENGRVIVLFSMRSDFVSNCATYPALNELLSQQFRQIGAMQSEELVSAIALPARHVGLPIEDELIARIINDMKGEPGALPLMQFALKDLFDSQQEKGGVIALTLEEYLRHGGIQKSLERHADSALAALEKKEQNLARSIFSGLIEIGRGTQDTRRTALFDELVPANTKAQDVLVIVQKLADARLIITDEQAGNDTVTISHEKLIDAWPWLKKLVNENRDMIALQNEIASDAKEWEEQHRDASYLYTGARLANAREKLATNKIVLSGLASEFVVRAQAQRRRNQITRILGVALPMGLVILAVILFSYLSATNSANIARQNENFANTQQASASTSDAIAAIAQASAEEAQMQATIARARELGTQSILQRDIHFFSSLLLGVEAFHTMDLPTTRGALFGNSIANPRLIRYLSGHYGSVYGVAFSPDGSMFASGSSDDTIILWDAKTHQSIGERLEGHDGNIYSVVFSPDGNTLASGSVDNTIILWDVKTQQPIGEPLQEHSDTVQSVAFSPNGNMLASGSVDNTIILWDVKTQQPIGEPLQEHSDTVQSVAFSPNGNMLASGSVDNTIILWDVKTQQPIGETLHGHSSSVNSVAFSPDGDLLASGSFDDTILLWDVKTHQQNGDRLQGHSASVLSLAFSPDGKTLISGSADQTMILWDIKTGRLIGQTLRGHRSFVDSLAFSPDGNTIVSGSTDGTIILWDAKPHQPIGGPLQGHSGTVNSVAFSPDSTTLASGSADNTIILWDVKTGQQIGEPFQGHSHHVSSVAFSPDGSILASSSLDGKIMLWDLNTHQPIGEPFPAQNWAVRSVAFSPDGNTLATGGDDNIIILWDVKTHQPIGEPFQGHSSGVLSVAFSPDGNTLASGSFDTTIILRDVKTGQQIGEPLQGHNATVRSVAFSPDGNTLASGGDDNTIFLWDAKTGQQIREPFHGHSSFVDSVAFSPDGNTLASGSWDDTIILWDVNAHQQIGSPIQRHSNTVTSVAFSPNGNMLASGSWDTTIILWHVNPQSWVETSCQRAGRNFTREEWTQYFPNEEYRKTCPQWPVEP